MANLPGIVGAQAFRKGAGCVPAAFSVVSQHFYRSGRRQRGIRWKLRKLLEAFFIGITNGGIDLSRQFVKGDSPSPGLIEYMLPGLGDRQVITQEIADFLARQYFLAPLIGRRGNPNDQCEDAQCKDAYSGQAAAAEHRRSFSVYSGSGGIRKYYSTEQAGQEAADMSSVIDAGNCEAEPQADHRKSHGPPEKPSELAGMQPATLAPEKYQQGAIYAENGA